MKKRDAIIATLIVIFSVLVSHIYLDREVHYWFQGLPRYVIDLFEIITRFGKSDIYLIVSILAFLFFRYLRINKIYANRAIFIFSSVAISGIIVNITKIIFGRMRPVMLKEGGMYGFDFFRLGYEYASFPSGHTTTAFALALALSLIYASTPMRIILFLFALAVGLSRVVIGSHYLGDALAGVYVGVATVLVLKQYFDRRLITL